MDGVFAVSHGHRAASHNASTTRVTSHIHYNSLTQTPKGNVNVEIPSWAAASSSIYAN